MKNFGQNLAALIKVKTIVTMIVITVFTILSLRGDITADNVMYIVTTVIAFYFGTQHEKKTNTTNIEEKDDDKLTTDPTFREKDGV